MVDHTGSMGGLVSLLNILHDKKMAIFSSTNTGDRSNIRHYIHMYIYDLLLGKEPFLNTSNACPGFEFGTMPLISNDEDIIDDERMNYIQFSNSGEEGNTNKTIGTYKNFAYWDLIFYQNTTDQEIYMSYGPVAHWRLQRRGEDLTFTGEATMPLWTLRVSWIEFKGCYNQPCDSVTVSFESEDPPTFYRNPGPEPKPKPPCLI